MDLSLELEKQYHHLRNRVFRVVFARNGNKQDAEDVFHDVCVHILENEVSPGGWGGIITKVSGKNHTDRHRKGRREVPLE